MRMSLLPAALVGLATLAASPASQVQQATEFGVQDYLFHENADGSIVAADQFGTYYFATFSEYVQSSFFVDHGLRCGSKRLQLPFALGTTSDCSGSQTNPAAEYEPTGSSTLATPEASVVP